MSAGWIQIVAAVLGVSAWASVAEAQEAAPRATPVVVAAAPTTETSWYGWQTLIADGAALTLAGATLAASRTDLVSTGLGLTSLGAYALGAPIVHFAHGNAGRGFASLGIRTAAPIVSGVATGLLGVVLECAAGCGGEWGGAAGMLIGGAAGVAVGVVGSVVVDAAVLAREDVPVEKPREQSLRVVPNAGYDPKRGAATFGLSGSF